MWLFLSEKMEKIVRERVEASLYWKEQCFAVTAETILDRAVGLVYASGLYGGNQSASPFLCLLAKLIQLQPGEDIVQLLVTQTEWKYVRVLAAFYCRLVASPVSVYSLLEPLLQDYRKIRIRAGGPSI
jgi:pre-mRNA-splicing factor 38A